jgi:hypothetical protein
LLFTCSLALSRSKKILTANFTLDQRDYSPAILRFLVNYCMVKFRVLVLLWYCSLITRILSCVSGCTSLINSNALTMGENKNSAWPRCFLNKPLTSAS